MEIINIIGINLILALAILFGIVRGYKQGFKRTVAKLSLYVLVVVGLFFLAPIVSNLLLGITAVSTAIGSFTTEFTLVIFAGLSLFTIGSIDLVIDISVKKRIIKVLSEKEIASRKVVRKTVAKVTKTKKQLKQEAKARNKELYKSRPKNSTKNKVFGAFAGLIVGLVFALVIYLPIRQVAIAQNIVGIESSIIEIIDNGQIDKIIDIIR